MYAFFRFLPSTRISYSLGYLHGESGIEYEKIVVGAGSGAHKNARYPSVIKKCLE